MTDIRRHLPLIISCLRRQLAQQSSVEASRTELGKLLPASYGINAGSLQSAQGERSAPFEIVIYDKTIPSPQAECEPAGLDIRRALAVIKLAQAADMDTLAHSIEAIASAKRLRPAIPIMPEQLKNPSRVLSKLLPLGIIIVQQLNDAKNYDQEGLILGLDALLKDQNALLRPDFLLVPGSQLSYQNPLFEQAPFSETTINIACEPALSRPRSCYVCKQRFTRRHFFYPYLCLPCADLNYRKRTIPLELTGRCALVTGARIRIGYATALRLLRAGAHVIATTRFPHDAARRYSSEPDFAEWQERLQIYGLDFRNLPVLEHFIAHLQATYSGLDILINNAAQTVRRPVQYYAALQAGEAMSLSTLPAEQQLLIRQSHIALPAPAFPRAEEAQRLFASSPLALAQADESAALAAPITGREVEPVPPHNGDQPNSWTLRLDEISLSEFLEVQVINVTAPFLLISRLRPLIRNSSFPERFVVNVSAIEGQFAHVKQGSHPHTNMAKASLNMLTHSAAADLATDHIYMNSVDPGWISLQTLDPESTVLPEGLPLDLVDAAARICDPIFTGIQSGKASSGQFYKDYQAASW
ncbi:SDR family oxidoreductase [Ktedonosporobacter rubrisoli]|uniref:SDR family oxidoreductase n=1 Tax=Ktedonosporobacter rubrisoli TaxID=2509675 RepID=A0A4P6JUT2_KTERU|nr:SDR family oxidoreductase [Ktedonosporobacter rubrisoli]QBD79408.1 SDR family oxidoreductase [Ktedonosporobacter rubrisoli]